ncbi:MAG: hypothetical protein U1E27_05280, partial [Kiritimatiellia bacterium]|nr:hypothetical protein [Kiritimatiellia bacterium]
MTINELPTGSAPPAIHFPHFPTLWQAVLWRNWELVSVTRLARILETSEGRLLDAARALGLPTPPDVQPAWIRRGYATLIRANWHLLPYGQLLDLLGWTPDQMFLHLQEDDFLWTKLGYLKPACETVRFTPLTLEQVSRTACIREALQDFHSENRPRVPPFAFVEEFERPLPVSFQRTAQDRTNEPASFSPLFIYSYSAT